MQIAQTILDQLGGRRFAVLTGAKNFVGSENALTFALPQNFARQGINRVRVTLTPADVYTVEFFKIRGAKVAAIETVEDVYCDSLQNVFEDVTGLYTTL